MVTVEINFRKLIAVPHEKHQFCRSGMTEKCTDYLRIRLITVFEGTNLSYFKKAEFLYWWSYITGHYLHVHSGHRKPKFTSVFLWNYLTGQKSRLGHDVRAEPLPRKSSWIKTLRNYGICCGNFSGVTSQVIFFHQISKKFFIMLSITKWVLDPTQSWFCLVVWI